MPSPAQSEPAPTARFAALRYRNYRLFLGGQFVSLVGTWMQAIAQSWLVYQLTGSEVQLGLIGFAGQFPVFLLAPLGGSLADTHDRHRIVVASQTAAMILAFLLAALTLTGSVQLWHVYVLATLGGIVNAFDMPARQAFLVEMVGREDLMNAIALNSSMFNAARIVGPAVAGVLVAAVGEGWCFFVNGVSFFAVLAGLLRMNRVRRPTLARPEGHSALAHASEGLVFTARTPPIRALMLMLALMSLMGMSYTVLMPIFADRILRVGAQGLGLMTGASGVGALFGALTVASRSGLKGMGRLVSVSAAGFGVCLVAFSVSTTFWLSTALMVPAGFTVMVEMAAANSMIQAMVPDRLRGRVMAVYSMMLMGMAPFGALISGFLARSLGAPTSVRLGGVACVAGAVVFAARWPSFREQAKEMILAERSSAEPSGF